MAKRKRRCPDSAIARRPALGWEFTPTSLSGDPQISAGANAVKRLEAAQTAFGPPAIDA
jgi:hypothetical protein